MQYCTVQCCTELHPNSANLQCCTELHPNGATKVQIKRRTEPHLRLTHLKKKDWNINTVLYNIRSLMSTVLKSYFPKNSRCQPPKGGEWLFPPLSSETCKLQYSFKTSPFQFLWLPSFGNNNIRAKIYRWKLAEKLKIPLRSHYFLDGSFHPRLWQTITRMISVGELIAIIASAQFVHVGVAFVYRQYIQDNNNNNKIPYFQHERNHFRVLRYEFFSRIWLTCSSLLLLLTLSLLIL